MIIKHLAAGLVATTILAAPALAQNNPATPAPSGQTVSGPNGVQFYTQTSGSADWRASKFMGVDIYGSNNNEKIGDVNDIVLDHDGMIQAVVIGVGGFLGIGEKNVAVPFKSVEWSTQPMRSSTASTAATGMNNGTAAGGNAGTAAGTGTAMNNGTAAGTSTEVTGSTAGSAKIAYPDHGMLKLTKDELKAAPTYTYPDDTKSTTAQ